jgi:hypothetical protein
VAKREDLSKRLHSLQQQADLEQRRPGKTRPQQNNTIAIEHPSKEKLKVPDESHFGNKALVVEDRSAKRGFSKSRLTPTRRDLSKKTFNYENDPARRHKFQHQGKPQRIRLSRTVITPGTRRFKKKMPQQGGTHSKNKALFREEASVRINDMNSKNKAVLREDA